MRAIGAARPTSTVGAHDFVLDVDEADHFHRGIVDIEVGGLVVGLT